VVISPDGHRLEGWITSAAVLRALARQITGTQAEAVQAQAAAWDHDDAAAVLLHPQVSHLCPVLEPHTVQAITRR